jgi:hypothetical protein
MNNSVTFEHLKVMNKKFAFSAVQKGPKKMVTRMINKCSNASIVIVNLLVVIGSEMMICGKNTRKGNKPMNNFQKSMGYAQRRLNASLTKF